MVKTDNTTLSITDIESVSGEAFVNNRKNKLIPSYELEVRGLWQGQCSNHGR